jgi:FkbM family methyltransferase
VRNYWNIVVGDIEPEMKHLDKIVKGRTVAVDVGANHGMYSLRLSHMFKHCHAFELNSTVIEDLKNHLIPNLTIHEVGLGSEDSTHILSIPLDEKGRELSGWGTVEKDVFPEGVSVVHKEVRTIRLDSLNLQDIDFIKIDVEGHECRVLEGSIETLRRCRPRILIEVKESNTTWVNNFFSGLDYTRLVMADIVPGYLPNENVIFVPNG